MTSLEVKPLCIVQDLPFSHNIPKMNIYTSVFYIEEFFVVHFGHYIVTGSRDELFKIQSNELSGIILTDKLSWRLSPSLLK